MKILYILRTSFGLMGTNASYFIPNEVAKHHDVMVLQGPSTEAEQGLVVADHAGLNINTVDETDFDRRFEGICEYIENFQPDIIHVFYHHQALRLGKAIQKKYKGKVKLLLDIRTPLLEDNPRQRIRVQFRAMLLQNAFDMVATHSLYSVKTIFPFCWLPVRELSYGVNMPAFKVRTSGWKDDSIDLVYTGAIAKKRKIEKLLQGFKALLERQEASKYCFKLHLYGAGNRLDEMKELSDSLQLADNVVFHGLVKQQDLCNNLHKHSIGIGYVPFGIYKQAPALKTLEYMCAGLGVLASQTQPAVDLQKLGFKIKTYDNSEADFANKVLQICEEGWSKTSTETNLKFMNQFDWKQIVQDTLLPMYKELDGK